MPPPCRLTRSTEQGALGLSLQDLREQPQIFAMLKTEFRAVIVVELSLDARVTNQTLYQYLPPRPPQIHQAVYRCEPEAIINFSEQLDFFENPAASKRCARRSADCPAIRSLPVTRLTGTG